MVQQQKSSENFYCNVETIWHISKTGRNSQDERAFLPVFHSLLYAFSLAEKSAIASEILICCGQTASQLLHPMQAPGCLSSGTALSAIGAMNPPPVKLCSL